MPKQSPSVGKGPGDWTGPTGHSVGPWEKGASGPQGPPVTWLPQPRQGAHLAPRPPPAQPRLHTEREEPRPLLGGPQHFLPRLLPSYLLLKQQRRGAHEADVITPRPCPGKAGRQRLLSSKGRAPRDLGEEEGEFYFHLKNFML